MKSFDCRLLAVLALVLAFYSDAVSSQSSERRRASRSGPIKNLPVGADIKRDVNFNCPEEFGYYAHPTDCTQYYVCVFGGALLESCTGGLMYSHELQTCDWPRNVGCDAYNTGASDSERYREPAPSRQTEVPRGRFTVTPSSAAPPPPPHRSHPQPNPVITSRGQPRQFTNEDIIKQQQLYADIEDPADEIESDRQQRVYRGQPTAGPLRDRDEYGQPAAARSVNANVIPAYTSSANSGKVGAFSFGTQIGEQRTQTPVQEPRPYKVTNNEKTDENDNDVQTNNIEDKPTKGQTHFFTLIRTKRDTSSEEMVTGDDTVIDRYDLDETDRDKRQVRNGRLHLSPGFISNNAYKQWNTVKPAQSNEYTISTQPPSVRLQSQSQNSFKPYTQNNNNHQQVPYSQYTTIPSYNFQTHPDSGQIRQPFKASTPDPFFDNSYSFYPHGDTLTSIITKSPPISSLTSTALSGGFYNNNSPAFSFNHERPQNSYSFYNSNQNNPYTDTFNEHVLGSHKLLDSTELSTTVVTQKPITVKPMARLRYRIKSEQKRNNKPEPKETVNQTTKTNVKEENRNKSNLESIPSEHSDDDVEDGDDEDEDEEIDGEDEKQDVEEDEEDESSEDSDKEEEDDPNFKKIDLPEAPTYDYSHLQKKYENIVNPFADPNFDFDSFIAKIRDSHLSLSEPTTPKYKSSIYTSSPYVEVAPSASNAPSPKQQRNLQLNYKGMSTPRPFSMPTKTMVSWPAKIENIQNVSTESKDNSRNKSRNSHRTQKPVHEVSDEYDQQPPKYVAQSVQNTDTIRSNRYSQPHIVDHYQQQANPGRHRDENKVNPKNSSEGEIVYRPATHIKNTNFRGVEILPKKVQHIHGGQSPHSGLSSNSHITITTKPHAMYQSIKPHTISVTIKPQYSNGGKPQFTVTGKPHLLITGKPHISVTPKPHIQISHLPLILSTPNPQLYTFDSYQKPLGYVTPPPKISTPAYASFLNHHTVRNTTPVSIVTPTQRYNPTTTAIKEQPKGRRPIPKPSPEMNDYYYDEDDDDYYYEPPVKSKFMPSSEVRPQRPPIAQNDEEYDDDESYEDSSEENKGSDLGPAKYVKVPQNARPIKHNIRDNAQVQDQNILQEYVQRLPSTRVPIAAHNSQNVKTQYNLVTSKPTAYELLVDNRQKIPVPVIMNNHENTKHYIMKRPEVSDYEVTHYKLNASLQKSPNHNHYHESGPNTSKPPKYLNQTTLRPYTVRHRLAKPPAGYENRKRVHAMNETKTVRGEFKWMKPDSTNRPTTKDSHNQESRTTRTKLDETSGNSLEPTEPAYTQTRQPVNSGRALYNGSQNYNPEQYDPYYPLYDEDGELYRDSDYVQQYNSASQRPSVGVQQTYRSTPLPPPPPPRRPASPAPPVVYTSAPAPISAEDYDDALIQGQLDNENQYQQPIRQSTRGEGNELGYEQPTRFTSVLATTASTTTTTTTPSTTTSTTTPSTTTTTTQRPTTAPTTEAMIPTRKSQRSTTDESLTRSLNAPSTETSTVVTITLSPISIQNPSNKSVQAALFTKTEPAQFPQAQIISTQSQFPPAQARPPPAQSPRLTENVTNDRRYVSLTTGFSLRRDPNSDSANPYTLKIIKRPTLTFPYSKEVNNLHTLSLSTNKNTAKVKNESEIKDFSYESKEVDYKDFVTVRNTDGKNEKSMISDIAKDNFALYNNDNIKNVHFIETNNNSVPIYNRGYNDLSQESKLQNESTTNKLEENYNRSETTTSEYNEKHPRLFLKTVIKRPLPGHKEDHNNLQSDDSEESDSILTFLKHPFFGHSKITTPYSLLNSERRSDIYTTEIITPYRKELTHIHNSYKIDNEYSGVPNVSPYTSLDNLRGTNSDKKYFQNDSKRNKVPNTLYDLRKKENSNDKQLITKHVFPNFVLNSSRFEEQSEFNVHPATSNIPIQSTPRLIEEKSSNPLIEALSKYFKILPIRLDSSSSTTTQKTGNIEINTFTVTPKSVEINNLNNENRNENRDVINIGFHKKNYEQTVDNVSKRGPRIEIKNEHSVDNLKSIDNYDGFRIPSLGQYVNAKSNSYGFFNRPNIFTSTPSPSTHEPVTVLYERPDQYSLPGTSEKSEHSVSDQLSENIPTQDSSKPGKFFSGHSSELLPNNVAMARHSESTTRKFQQFDEQNSKSSRRLESTYPKYEDVEKPSSLRPTTRTIRRQEYFPTKHESFEEPNSFKITPKNNKQPETTSVQSEDQFEEPINFQTSPGSKRREEFASNNSIHYEEFVEPKSIFSMTAGNKPFKVINSFQTSSESNKISTEETSTTLTMTTTTSTIEPTTPLTNKTSIPIRASRINPAIKLAATYPGAARRSFQSTSKCATDNSLQQNPKCNEILPQRTSSRGRGTAHYSTSGGDAPSYNRGTPPSRGRPTLKPSTSIVSKALEFVDIYRHPASRPAAVYPQPTPDKTAAKCRRDVCLLPDCSCGGKDIPGGLHVEQVPQIVLITFDDAVNDLNKGTYAEIFEQGRVNPNGCPISATFYVSHEWSDYSQVQNLYADGHEMASHTISHSFGEQFSQKKWNREVSGQREILAAYGGVKLEDVRGMRAPFLSVGGNKMFKMLYDSNFTYDSSMPVYENRPPSWPYTLDYKLFHDCMIPPCPTRSYPGVWEVPMVMWQDLNGGRCSMGDACSNPPTAEGVLKMLLKNFDRHYTTNRAPFGLFYHAAWFTQPHHKEGFIMFLDTINRMQDVFLVTNWQALQWVRDPTPLDRMNSFQPFQCDYQDRPKRCNNPKVCNLWHKSGVRYMRTCQPCPDIYPWTGKTGIRSSKIDNEVED